LVIVEEGHGSDNSSAENHEIKTTIMWPHVTHGAVAYLAPGIFSVFLIFVVIASAGTPSRQVLDILHVRKDDFETKYSYFSEKDRLRMVQASRDMFYFGYDNYMKYAFPQDELNPILCSGRGPDLKDP
jgi:hypothetical protein